MVATYEDLKRLISRKELAVLLNVSERTLCRWERQGLRGVRLEGLSIGKNVYYLPAAVEAFRAAAQH